MAYMYSLIICAFLALFSKPAAAQSSGLGLPNPIHPFIPVDPYQCPYLLPSYPYLYPCPCDFSICIAANLEALIEQLANRIPFPKCLIQQWSLIINSIVPNMDINSEYSILSYLAESASYEIDYNHMTLQFPPYCNGYPGSTYPPGATYPPGGNPYIDPILTRREPLDPTVDLGPTLSPYSTPYMNNMMGMLGNFMPYSSPTMMNQLGNALYMNLPPQYFPYLPALYQKLSYNFQAIFSMMGHYSHYPPYGPLYNHPPYNPANPILY